MMNKYLLSLAIQMILMIAVGSAQESQIKPTHVIFPLDDIEELYDQGLYGQVRQKIDQYYDQKMMVSNDKKLINNIPLMSKYHISGLKLNLPDAENRMDGFIGQHMHDPELTEALFEFADFKYQKNDFKSAIYYFDLMDTDHIDQELLDEISFKKGYAHFIHKEFDNAIREFSFAKDHKGDYFYPINYYYGMAKYYKEDYNDAIKSFRRIEKSSVYKQYIPYYLTQIYFNNEQYDQLILYTQKIILDPSTEQKEKISYLLGQTYFMKNEFEKALPHLEYYEDHTDRLTKEEFYQLAFTQYQLGYYTKAKENFLELTGLNDEMGQVSNYYLADCYTKTGNKTSARSAFKKVSEMNFNKSMQEEARFNYGKLSSELGYERESINILTTIEPSSPYYKETQYLINDMLKNTSDYDNAIAIIDRLPSLNNELKATYQEMTFRKALQYYNQEQEQEAEMYFTKSSEYPMNPALNAQTKFWLAMIKSRQRDFESSTALFQDYFAIANSGIKLPEETSLALAYYYQGYNNLRQNDHKEASIGFTRSVEAIDREQYTNTVIADRLLQDAVIRAGDTHFKLNQYPKAKKYYNRAINNRYVGYVYPLYQRSVIEGLEGERFKQIQTLQSIRDDHARSKYADDALLALGDSYFQQGNYEAAEINLNKLIKNYEGRSNLVIPAHLKLGLIKYNDDRPQEALAHYKEVIRQNPSSNAKSEALKAIEEIYIDNLRQSEEYISYIDSLPGTKLTDYSRDSLSYVTAQNPFRYGKYDIAIDGYSNYIKRFPEGYYKLKATYERGESYLALKQYDEALIDYNTVINHGMSEYYDRALKKAAIISYNHTQDFDQALKINEKLAIRSSDPQDQYMAKNYAMKSAFRLGKDADVMKYAQQVITSPIASSDDQNSANYYLAKITHKLNNLEEAYMAFDHVSKHAHNNQAAESAYMLAYIRYQQGRLAEANQLAQAANTKNTAYPYWIAKSLILISDIYRDQEDLLNARAAIEAVVENFTSDEEIIAEAQQRLSIITEMETAKSRIKQSNQDGTIELDTIKQN